MTTVADACAELTHWLPQAQQLITQPDQDGQTARHQATESAPPWNPGAAMIVLDIHEGIRRLEQQIRQTITGRPGIKRGGSDANTIAAISAVSRLAEALSQRTIHETTIVITRWTTTIRQQPAIDELPVLDRLPNLPEFACPYCGVAWLLVARASGMVTCGVPDCLAECDRPGCGCDGRGHRRWARPEMGHLGPVLAWPDGTLQ
jgi:hypothetical protein